MQPLDSTGNCVIGIANPSGVNGKALSFLELPGGIWNIAETQCTDVGFRHFAGEIRAFQPPSRRLRLAHGAFAPPRVGSRSAGSWTGVAQMADFPLRQLDVPWRGHEWTSGRSLFSSFQVGPHCVLGAVLYAPPKGPTYSNAPSLTAELLQTVTEELVLGQSGPRFVAGDFNTDSQGQAAFHHWRSLGWEECQDLAYWRFQRPYTATCKGSTYPDQLWLSPELARWLRQVDCWDTIFADHALLFASFDFPTHPVWQHTWFQPPVLPWETVDFDKLEFDSQEALQWGSDDLTSSFKNWSQLAEGELHRGVLFLGEVPLPKCISGPLHWFRLLLAVLAM
eukprot:Skav203520  [mRNA]  locus=scaffold687:164543:165553:+ [translate_table: standard]